MKFSLRLFIIFLGVSVCAGAWAKPNVVIFFTDDQGTLDAGCYGADDLKTPAIDRIAAAGVRFTQGYAHTVCCPARAMLMTGRHPQRSGVTTWTQNNIHAEGRGVNMALEEVTLAEALRGAGYRTALFGKWHLGSHRDHGPTKQGFDEFFGIRNGFIDNYNHHFLHGKGHHDLFEGTEEKWMEGKFFPRLIVDRSLEFIERNQEQPFFLYLAFNTPHYPEQAEQEFLEMYRGMAMPRRTYAAFTSNTDAWIGEVLDKLEGLGLLDETIVVFQADNGHSAEDKGPIDIDDHASGLPNGHYYSANGGGGYTGKWIGHKGTFLEGGIRVPTLLSYPPKIPRGIVRDQAVTAMDFMPTILGLCGVPAPEGVAFDGHDLAGVIADAEAASPYGKVMHWGWRNSWAVREGDWKLIGTQGRGKGAKTEVSLHHLAGETPEVRDYAPEKPELVARLKGLHEAWARAVAPAD